MSNNMKKTTSLNIAFSSIYAILENQGNYLTEEAVLMMYLLALVLPPLAVLLVGKPFQAILNLILTLFFWLPGAIHAILVVHEKKANKRMKKQAKLMAKYRNNR